MIGLINPAKLTDIPEIANLVNASYRGDSSRVGWTNEADLFLGPRTDDQSLNKIVNGDSSGTILCLREVDIGPIVGCVYLGNPISDGSRVLSYIGMLAVTPTHQTRGIGRLMLEHAENSARLSGAKHTKMTVLYLRTSLIAWYERRGYKLTGETEPFPYEEDRIGLPTQSDLYFVTLEKLL